MTWSERRVHHDDLLQASANLQRPLRQLICLDGASREPPCSVSIGFGQSVDRQYIERGHRGRDRRNLITFRRVLLTPRLTHLTPMTVTMELVLIMKD